MKTYEQIAYEAYCENRRWKSFYNDPLPPWNEVKTEIKDAWMAAVISVLEEIERRKDE